MSTLSELLARAQDVCAPEPTFGVWLGDYFAKSSELSFPSGAVLQIEGDKIVGRTEPNPNAPMCARDLRAPTQRECEVMFGVRLREAIVELALHAAKSPRQPHPANANLLVG